MSLRKPGESSSSTKNGLFSQPCGASRPRVNGLLQMKIFVRIWERLEKDGIMYIMSVMSLCDEAAPETSGPDA